MRFPKKVEEELKMYLIIHKNTWPYNKVGYHFGKEIISRYRFHMNKFMKKTVLLFYTCPFDMLLQYIRTLYNYSFTDDFKVIEQRYVKWTYEGMNDLHQLNITPDRCLNTLHLQFFKMRVGISFK